MLQFCSQGESWPWHHTLDTWGTISTAVNVIPYTIRTAVLFLQGFSSGIPSPPPIKRCKQYTMHEQHGKNIQWYTCISNRAVCYSSAHRENHDRDITCLILEVPFLLWKCDSIYYVQQYIFYRVSPASWVHVSPDLYTRSDLQKGKCRKQVYLFTLSQKQINIKTK